jgi:Tol biopolymer transport system component
LILLGASAVAVLASPALAGKAKPKTTRVSVSSSGEQALAHKPICPSWAPSISGNGRLVAFESCAPNLVAGDTNHGIDVFVHDAGTGKTKRVSVSSSGEQGQSVAYDPNDSVSISADGSVVAFDSYVPQSGDGGLFTHVMKTGKTRLVSKSSSGTPGNMGGIGPSLSADGRLIAFISDSSNLVAGDSNGERDVFVRDLKTGRTRRVSVTSKGGQADDLSADASLSGDGRFVAFSSYASNLVPHDTNGGRDIFVHGRSTGKTSRVDVSSSGDQAHGSSESPSISANGRFVAFVSTASNLVRHDTNDAADVFLRDRKTGRTRLVSIGRHGKPAGSSGCDAGVGPHSCRRWTTSPAISTRGRFVAFDSAAPNLVRHDKNHHRDVFVRDMKTGKTRIVSVGAGGRQGNGLSEGSAIATAGRFVAFESDASNLVAGDTNDHHDVFRRGPLR